MPTTEQTAKAIAATLRAQGWPNVIVRDAKDETDRDAPDFWVVAWFGDDEDDVENAVSVGVFPGTGA